MAATLWQFVVERIVHISEPREGDYVADRAKFPPRSRDDGIRIGDRTLYPRGRPQREEVDLALRLRPATLDIAGIRAEVDVLITPNMGVTFHVASHVDGGRTVEEPLAPVLNRDALVGDVLKLLGGEM